MSKNSDATDKLDKMSTGGHLGGTKYGQVPGEAKSENGERISKKGDKARPNDGSN